MIVNIINAILFYCGWFLTVTNAARGRPDISLIVCTVIVLIHLLMIQNRIRELFVIGVSVGAGFIVESMMIHFQILKYENPNILLPGYAPFWILGLYAIFATTINHSLGWIRRKHFLAAIFGFIGAAISYSAGEYLGAVELLMPKGGSVMVIGIFWFMLMPLLYIFNDDLLP